MILFYRQMAWQTTVEKQCVSGGLHGKLESHKVVQHPNGAALRPAPSKTRSHITDFTLCRSLTVGVIQL